MSRDTLSILKRHLKEKKRSVVPNIVQEHLYFDMYEGVARNKKQIDATAGAMVGEATRQGMSCTWQENWSRNKHFKFQKLINILSVSDNKARVYYGLMKEPDLQFVPAEEEEEPEVIEGDKPKKKKPKKDPLFSKKTKSDPNAPTVDRMPLPEL
jgi:transcription initiation factor TFIID subunit 5